MVLSIQEKETFWTLVRQMIYFYLVLFVIFFLWFLAEIYKEQTFVECGIVENIQLVLLITSGTIFVSEAFVFKKDTSVLLCLASLCFFATCRELDILFDSYLSPISWEIGFIFPLLAGFNLLKRRGQIISSILRLVQTPAFNLMLTAMLIGVALAQALGHRTFIITVLGNDSYARPVRRMLEEGTELVGYFLILLSSIECYWNFNIKKRLNNNIKLEKNIA